MTQLGEHGHLFTTTIYRLSIITRPSSSPVSRHSNPESVSQEFGCLGGWAIYILYYIYLEARYYCSTTSRSIFLFSEPDCKTHLGALRSLPGSELSQTPADEPRADHSERHQTSERPARRPLCSESPRLSCRRTGTARENRALRNGHRSGGGHIIYYHALVLVVYLLTGSLKDKQKT